MRRVALVAACALALSACGGNDKPTVKVAAASSLTDAFTSCLGAVHATGEFGGSGDLDAQIRQGVGIDVFASGNMELPQALAADGKAGKAMPFATNELVLAVPAGDGPIRTFADLARTPATQLAIGAQSVAVGGYTQEVLDRLPTPESRSIRREIRSEEPDLQGIVGKVLTGAADAGFVYRTDVLATKGKLRAVTLPRAVEPTVVYGLSLVRKGDAAQKVVDDILRGGCHRALLRAGFGTPGG
jgi:molybdate transport system substrate-binding protein